MKKINRLENLNDLDWDRYLEGSGADALLLQSSLWKDVAKAEGYRVERLAWEDSGNLLCLAQILIKKFRFFKLAYIPKGPILALDLNSELIKEIQEDLLAWAKQENLAAISFEPENEDFIKDFAKETKAIQPKQTLILDLSLSEEDLLKRMHSKTRYNIRLANRHGLSLIKGSEEDILDFYNLLNKTSKRNGFKPHPLKHYQNILKYGRGKLELYLVKYNDKLLSAGLFSFYGTLAIYLHGASSSEDRKYMSNYFIQWEMIKRAKSLGLKYYDFYGIDRKKWPGVTRFKLGFAGEELEYPGTYEIVFNPFFKFYKFLKNLKRILFN